MVRRALIIGSPGGEGEEYLPGVKQDVENYTSFLQSPIGGLWKPDEIKVLWEPTSAVIGREVSAMKTAQYSLTVFSGHGYHSGSTETTVVMLNSTPTELDSTQLRQGAPRHTLILDCCRVVMPVRLSERIVEKSIFDATRRISPERCRKAYDQEISECSPGLVVMFGCSLNETSGDSKEGGYYSHSLLRQSEHWANELQGDTSRYYYPLSVVRAHEMAAKQVQQISGNRQTPEIERPRTSQLFPFAIVA